MRPASWTSYRRSWVWLLAGTVLLPFAQFQTVLPLASWVAPIFLLRFARTQRPWLALSMLALAQYLGATFSLRGVLPTPTVYLFGLTGMLGVLPYGLDLLLARRFTGLVRTLPFPLASVALDWLFGLSGFGTLGSPAYSQVGALPLTQLVSVTGIWGLVFLMAWLAPAVNDAWEHRFAWPSVRTSLLPVAIAVLLVVLLGSLRLAFAPPAGPTVRVAGLAADRVLWHGQRVPPLAELAAGSDAVRGTARAAYAPVVDELFARTTQVARAGATIVVWSEAAAFTLTEDEPALIVRAQQVARQEAVYLQLGLIVVLRSDHAPYAENRAILIDPAGTVVWDYAKTIHPLGDAAVFAPGPGIVPTVQTPYGVLATVICFDADYPALVRQAGLAGADILLVPSNDWQPIDTMHARANSMRAIENGVALVRPTGNGLSLAVDHLGQERAVADYFATDRLTMVADVPMNGVPTIYAHIGDSVAYAAITVLGALAALAMRRRRSVALGTAQPA